MMNKITATLDDKKQYELRLSPSTKFVIDATLELLNHKDAVLLEFPSNTYKSLLFVGYEYSREHKSTTIIIVGKENIQEYNDQYYLLQSGQLPCHVGCAIGIKRKDQVYVIPKVPKSAKKSIKKQLREQIIKDIKNDDKPRIILCSDLPIDIISEASASIPELRNKALLIMSGYDYRGINELLKIIDHCRSDQVKCVIASTFIPDEIVIEADNNNIGIISMRSSILNGSDFIRNESTHYYEDIFPNKPELYSHYNIDKDHTFNQTSSVEIISVDSGKNLIRELKHIWACNKQIASVSTELKNSLNTLSSIANLSIQSFCSIDHIKKYSPYHSSQVNGNQICGIIESSYSSLNSKDRILCKEIVNSFWNIRNEIEHCRNPFFDNGYTKHNKFSKTFELIKKTKDNIVLLTTNTSETMTLYRFIEQDGLSGRVRISNVGKIESLCNQNTTLIISGRPSSSQAFVLTLPFKKTILLSYKGNDFDLTTQALRSLQQGNQIVKQSTVNSLKLIANSKHSIQNSYKAFFSLESQPLEEMKPVDLKEPNDESIDLVEFNKTQNNSTNVVIEDYTHPKKGALQVTFCDRDGNHIVKYCNKNKLFAILDDTTNSIIELPLSEDLINHYTIARFETNTSSTSLTDILIELYDLDQKSDISVIDLWSEAIQTLNLRDIDDVYETYREIGGDKQKNTLKTWLNGRTMGPESIEDISIVGSISGITEIIDNAKYIDEQFNIIRNQKRLIGRYLFKVISDILHHNPNSEDDPRTEILRNTLSERIFRIEAVTTIQ